MSEDFDLNMIAGLADMMEAETVRANGEISELVKALETDGCPSPALVHAVNRRRNSTLNYFDRTC